MKSFPDAAAEKRKTWQERLLSGIRKLIATKSERFSSIMAAKAVADEWPGTWLLQQNPNIVGCLVVPGLLCGNINTFLTGSYQELQQNPNFADPQ